MWNYAQLSKAAKAAGGPEKFIKMLKAAGYACGRKDQLILDLAIAGVGIGIYGGYKFYSWITNPKIKALEHKISR